MIIIPHPLILPLQNQQPLLSHYKISKPLYGNYSTPIDIPITKSATPPIPITN